MFRQVRQFEGMLSPLLSPPLPSLPNATMAWAALAIEELTRLGVSTFAVAPGKRVTPSMCTVSMCTASRSGLLAPAAARSACKRTYQCSSCTGIGVVCVDDRRALSCSCLCLRAPRSILLSCVHVCEAPASLCLCVFTGSRSSPLALAAASHPRSQLTVAIDERSLGFWALGYGRANPTGERSVPILHSKYCFCFGLRRC
jgi:hypothetical protein